MLSWLSNETVFGLKNHQDLRYAEELINSFRKIKQQEIIFNTAHRLAKFISQGPAALTNLLELARRGKREARLDALDAMCQVFLKDQPGASIIIEIRKMLAAEKNGLLISAIAKTLAMAHDRGFLLEQLARLTDEDPGVVAAAAQLLGYGRLPEAAVALRALVSPSRVFESRPVIWALGEIGDRAAIPTLERCLQEGFRVSDALIALGKIASLTSIPSITRVAFTGVDGQKESAYRALAMLLQTHRGDEAVVKILAEEISPAIDSQLQREHVHLNWETRFFMLMCLARLGNHLRPSQIRRYLDLKISAA